MPKINPTVGRVVWFYKFEQSSGRHFGPLAAHVCKVHSETTVNLMVIGDGGVPFSETSVRLVQAQEEAPATNYCRWMPYQLGQVAMTEAAARSGT